MKIDIQEVNETRKTVVVTVPAEEVDAEEKNVLRDISKQARLPGFRPGKAPEAMIRKKFSKDIANELDRRMSNKVYEEIQTKDDIDIVQVVTVDHDPFRAGQEGSITFTVDVRPQFEVPEYKGLEIQAPPTEVTDEEIQRAVDEIRNQRAEFNVVERAAQKGDYVKLSYEGSVEGQPIDEIAPEAPLYGKQSTTWEEAGNHDVPGVDAVVDGIIGMAAGDTKTVEQSFAEDHEVEALRGKTGTYEIKVEEVREKELPEVDENFLKSLQMESEEDFRKRIKDDLHDRKMQNADQAKRSTVSEKLLAAVDFPIPESLVENEREQLLRNHMQRLLQQGITEEQMEEHKEQMISSATEAARRQVKLQLILGEISKKENITVENEDLHQRVMQEAMMTRTKPDQLVKELQKDRSRVLAMQREVLFHKTLDFVIEQANVTEAEPEAATTD